MARAKKASPTLEALFFASPEQKVLRILLSEPTTSFSIRAFSSRLKGIRGLGGAEGLMRILKDLEELKLVEFVDNQRGIRLNDENPAVLVMKTFAALCDLEGLKSLLEPISTKGLLLGSRALGRARSDSTYELMVVTGAPDEARRIAGSHPLGKLIELSTLTADAFGNVERQDPKLASRLSRGIVVWGSTW